MGLDRTHVPAQDVNLAAIHASMEQNENLQGKQRLLDATVSNGPAPACLQDIGNRTAEVRFLGTAAAMPGKHRNVSGIFLNLFDLGCILLDCGEGTYGQMVNWLSRISHFVLLLLLQSVEL